MYRYFSDIINPLLYYKILILQYHEIFSDWHHQGVSASMAHDIVISIFCNIVMGQANYVWKISTHEIETLTKI